MEMKGSASHKGSNGYSEQHARLDEMAGMQ